MPQHRNNVSQQANLALNKRAAKEGIPVSELLDRLILENDLDWIPPKPTLKMRTYLLEDRAIEKLKELATKYNRAQVHIVEALISGTPDE